jgi:anti-sigma B factor antagonist
MGPCSISADANALSLALRGEIDFSVSALLTKIAREAIVRDRPERVRVDLADVTFLDSSGIGVLISVMRVADEVGADFRVENPSPNVFDQLSLTGLLDVFSVERPSGDDGRTAAEGTERT